ncbi:Fis family transcriptional regulator [Photobacterium sp. TY1-4]|uniref:Fis family transcriptional regulator n=1 Tax=Photobacterium sp. TY1-4 TaxID=2899122 RepID=UPI0021C049C3|nr:Fis family transcriptional regulator [Photobacterium sp. TY1-4]UXI02000.1 Fis family transcriptional regulator [Photobacterium sp. TY1-4]
MRKQDKKTDNQLRAVLTNVCDAALNTCDGFLWLTHVVNYANFPDSLKIVCVFETNAQLANFTSGTHQAQLNTLIQNQLGSMGIRLKSIARHVIYDSEENCDRQHQGNWAKRLQ